MVFYDTPDNFHPYECNGPARCPHCDRDSNDQHDPTTCALCASDTEAMPQKGDESP